MKHKQVLKSIKLFGDKDRIYDILELPGILQCNKCHSIIINLVSQFWTSKPNPISSRGLHPIPTKLCIVGIGCEPGGEFWSWNAHFQSEKNAEPMHSDTASSAVSIRSVFGQISHNFIFTLIQPDKKLWLSSNIC